MFLADSFHRGANLSGVALAVALACQLAASQAQAGTFCIPGPGDRPETGVHGGVPGFERQAPLGFQGFWCGTRKVGQHALYNRGNYGDTQLIVDDRGHCAYSSMRTTNSLTNPMHGTVVLDVSVASQPVDVQVLTTPAMRRAYSGFELQGNTMIAAQQNSDPFDVYDVSGNCLQPTFLATTLTAEHNHDGWLTADQKTYYGIPFGGQPNPEHPEGGQTGIRDNPHRIDMHVMDLSDRSNPVPLLNWNRRALPMEIFDKTSFTTNFHDVTTNNAGTRVYMALYGGGEADLAAIDACANGLLILDSSDVAFRRPNPELRFISWTSWCDQPNDPQFHYFDPDFGDGRTASTHTTEYVIHENGKEYVLTTDEGPALGGSANGMCSQTTYSRFIDISDETRPRVVSTFKPDVNKPANCQQNIDTSTTGGMLHYVNFDDRYNMRLVVYAASNQGIRFVDFRDPENPKEIAYYQKERHVAANAAPGVLFPNLTTGSTSVTGTDFTRPDPRYDTENCFWYTGWNQGGLVIIEQTNPEYNACLRRRTSGGGWLAGSGGKKNKIELDFSAQRADGGFGPLEGRLKLKDKQAGVEIHIKQLTMLGSLRDACGEVSARADAVQFEGTGTLNGSDASFRVCVRDNGEARGKGKKKSGKDDDFFLACTEGCNYSAGGRLGGGNIQVKQRPETRAQGR
jgi:hypothetical protein